MPTHNPHLPVMPAIEIVKAIAQSYVDEGNLIEDPDGPIVDDEIIAIAADMEVAIADRYGRDPIMFNFALLTKIKRAAKQGLDPIEVIKDWLADLLREEDVQPVH